MVCTNPTLLEPTTGQWYVHYAVSPFDGYLPFPLRELKQLNETDHDGRKGLILTYCQMELKKLIPTIYGLRLMDGIELVPENITEFILTDGHPVLRLILTNSSEQKSFNDRKLQSPDLGDGDKLDNEFYHLKSTQIHFFDNLQVIMNRNSAGMIDQMEVSFLLHDLSIL